MYTLLIADDEPLIRNGVRRIIDWESLGFSTVYLAENGVEALDIIRENHVDLVLTDIVMPFMDGLELSEILSKEYPEIHIVILTGHEDFEYAKQSVNLGVKNYILKPVGAETLYKEMQSICEKLHMDNTQREYVTSLKKQLQQSIPELQENVLNRIIKSSGKNLSQYLDRCKELGISLSEGPFEVCVVEMELSAEFQKNRDFHLLAAKQTIKGCLGQEHFVFLDNRDRIVLLFRGCVFDKEDDISEIIYQVLEIIKKTIDHANNITTTCGAGVLVDSAQQLAASYEGAEKALECSYSLGKDNVYDIRDLDYLEKSFYYPRGEIQDLINQIKMGDETQAGKTIQAILGKENQKKPLSGMNILMNYIATATALLQELSEINDGSSAIWNDGIKLFQTLNNMASTEEMVQNLYQFSARIRNEMKQIQKNSGQQIIEKVKQYVEDHYGNPDISLSTVSEYAAVSTGYLSGLFKKETGTNFVKYLTDVRMQRSIDLLMNTDKKTYEIAYETGFANPHYFSVAFKKHTGMSPSEFRAKE